MRILYLPSWFPSEKNPYAGAFIKELVMDIGAEDIQIDVAAFHYHYSSLERNTYTKEVLENDSIVHHFYGWVFPKINIYAQKSWIKTCIDDLEEQVDVGMYDIIHAHDYVASFVAQRLSNTYNIPLITSLHHSDFIEQNIPSWRVDALADVFEQSEIIICPSNEMKEIVAKDFALKGIQVIPNYIDSAKIPVKDSLPISPQKFIAISSSEKVKNNLKLLEFAENRNIELDIFGDIERVLIHKVENVKRIHFKGQISRFELLKIIKEYDAFISMSEIETFGISIIECLCAGIPGLVYNETGSKDYITEENGLFIRDHENAVRTLMANYGQYSVKAIRQSITSKFDKTHVIPSYEKLYRNIYMRLCVV